MDVNFHTVKLFGSMTAMVKEIAHDDGRASYSALIQWNKGTWMDERYCQHQHKSLVAAKRCARQLQWETANDQAHPTAAKATVDGTKNL